MTGAGPLTTDDLSAEQIETCRARAWAKTAFGDGVHKARLLEIGEVAFAYETIVNALALILDVDRAEAREQMRQHFVMAMRQADALREAPPAGRG